MIFRFPFSTIFGGLAQLARAPALHAGGQRFESVILHSALMSKANYDMMYKKSKVIDKLKVYI